MTTTDVQVLRKRVEALFAETQLDSDEFVALVDGHLAYRKLVGID